MSKLASTLNRSSYSQGSATSKLNPAPSKKRAAIKADPVNHSVGDDQTDNIHDILRGYDSDVNTHTSNAAVNQAKTDLMQLGIELDEELIQRLQTNLGIDKIFKVAHDAAHLIQSNAKTQAMNAANNNMSSSRSVAGGGAGAGGIYDVYGNEIDGPKEMLYRNVSSPTHDSKIGSQKLKKQNDLSSILTLNQKSSIIILKQLENRDDTIEPQYRPLIDQMIEYLRLLYIRSPKKFLYRLLNKKLLTNEEKKILFKKKTNNSGAGKNVFGSPLPPERQAHASNSAANNTNDPYAAIINHNNVFDEEELQLIYKWILQSRYFNYTEFEKMIKRILMPQSSAGSSSAAGQIPSAPNSPGSLRPPPPPNQSGQGQGQHPQYSDEVIRAFFLLICDEKRFENSQKKKVMDLWNFLTLLKISSDESRRSYDNTKSKIANDVEFWRRENNIKNLKQTIVYEHQQQQQQQSHSGGDAGNRDGWMNDRSQINIITNNPQHPYHAQNQFNRRKDSIAEPMHTASIAKLLGQNEYKHISEEDKGRSAKGTIFNEMVNRCNVATALNSPTKAVGNSGHARALSAGRAIRPHKTFMQRFEVPVERTDDILDSSKLAYLLGHEDLRKTYQQRAVSPSASSNSSSRRASSANRLNREMINRSDVAGALGRGDTSSHLRTSQDNSLGGYFGRKDVLLNDGEPSPYVRNQSVKNNRMRMTSVSNLYWESNEVPSVASALGTNNTQPRYHYFQPY